MESFLASETLVVELILVVSIVAMAVQRLRVPYTVALVLVGLVIAALGLQHFALSPEIVLGLLVPPLVFEASFQIPLNAFRRGLAGILLLAVPGVVITTAVVGGILASTTALPLAAALLFGALIAATDPVSVVALFRRLGAPRRLTVLIEGESLLNDGTAIVLFSLILGVALTGEVSIFQGLLDFLRVSVGGVLVGLALGWVISEAIARVDDYLIEITLTTVLAFGSYLVAEQLHVSGVLAVVAAGLINGNLGSRGMSPSTRIVLFNFWEYVAFLANSLIFLLIGLQVDVPALTAAWPSIAWAIFAVLLARGLVVYGLRWLSGRRVDWGPRSWSAVVYWGGLRGAISLALALSLPAALGPDGNLLRVMTFGVVLFTLLVEGTTMSWLIGRLRIIRRSPAQEEYEKRHAQLTAVRAALDRLDVMHGQGLLSTLAWETLRPEAERRVAAMSDALRDVLQAEPDLQTQEVDTARREMLRAQRAALLGLLRDGVISQEVHDELSQEINAVLAGERLAVVPGAGQETPALPAGEE